MNTDSFSEAEWYAEIFRQHQITSKLRSQRVKLPPAMRTRRVGGMVYPGEDIDWSNRGHPAKDVISAFDRNLLRTVPWLKDMILAEKKRLEDSSNPNKSTPNENNRSERPDRGGTFAEQTTASLQSWAEAEQFWNSIITKLKQIFASYFRSTSAGTESDEARACSLLAVIVSGVDPILDETDAKILQSLSERRMPVKVIDLAVDKRIGHSRRSLTPRLNLLESLDLINRPRGERGGVMITSKGREVLAELHSKPSH